MVQCRRHIPLPVSLHDDDAAEAHVAFIMKRPVLLLVIVLFIFGMLFIAQLYIMRRIALPVPEMLELERHALDLLRQERNSSTARNIRTFMKNLSQEQVAQLIGSENDDLAFLAVWHRIDRAREYDNDDVNFMSDRARFLGFVEGRLGYAIPDWWQVYLETVRFQPCIISSSEDDLIPSNFVMPRRTQHSARPSHARMITGETRVNNDQLSIVYSDGSRADLPYTSHRALTKIYAARDETGCFVVWMSGSSSSPCIIERYDCGTSERYWSSDVWAEGNIFGGGEGARWHRVELARIHKGIIVFGGSTNVMYIERFDIDTGVCTLRFVTHH